MRRMLPALLLLSAAMGGCDTLSSTIDTQPKSWADYEGHTVTVHGSAGNSELGPIVRFQDGSYIALKTRKPWAIDLLARKVEVKGQIVSGEGFRAERYILDPESIALLPPPVKQQ